MPQQQITEAGQAVEATAVAGKPGRFKIQLITPGWGSSGYYSADVLKEAAKDKIYPAGTRMMLDHPTWSQSQDRPEGEVMNWAATLEEDAYWDGKGLVASAEVYSPYSKLLAERAKWLGVSIRASAEVKQGEAEGRKGRIVEKLMFGETVDFVTKAGRGGQVLAVLEAERNLITDTDASTSLAPVQVTAAVETFTEAMQQAAEISTSPIVPATAAGQTTTESSKEMNMAEIADTELRELRESAGQADDYRLRAEKAEAALAEANARDTASARAREVLKESTLPPAAVDRIVSESVRVLSLKDGKLDEAAFDAAVEAAKVAEARYLESVAPKGVTGFGASATAVSESTRPTTNPWGRSLSAVKEA